MKQMERALVCVGLIGRVGGSEPEKDPTSYWLAGFLDCTPQTVTSTLLKHGKDVGVTYEWVEHRPGVGKRVWCLDKLTKYQYDKAEKAYKLWVSEKLKALKL